MFSGKGGDTDGGKLESNEKKTDPNDKIRSIDKGVIENNRDSLDSNNSNSNSGGGFQELTLSYLCEMNKVKGKEIVVENSGQEEEREDNRWVVERDFLQLSEIKANSSSKRELDNRGDDDDVEGERSRGDKKSKIEALNLSLALPDASLSLTPLNAVQNADPIKGKFTSTQGMAISMNNTQTTCSNDFTAASMSCSYSHPFSHNPSCSLTHNSMTENYSVGKESDQIWNAGEGTNGSVHSRFRPIGDSVVLANPGGGSVSLRQGSWMMNKDSSNNNGVYKTTSSDNISFFPSELPARPRIDGPSENSRGKGSENMRGLGSSDGGRARKISRPERILWETVSESIPVMAQIFQELTPETIELTKECLKNLINMPDKRDELNSIQSKLERRSDLTEEAVLKANINQLEILTAIKTGLVSFLLSKNRIKTSELTEIFLYTRCRNVNCKSMLPVDDCDCKICSTNKGFCSSCMCPVCLTFDCASNTCSWIGCDVCSHWCHTACGIERNLIKAGPSLKGPSGTMEMQFRCLGCGHASEVFGFVKDVFLYCAKDWSLETLKKELDCVRKIFKGSNDYKGKELKNKVEDMLSKVESNRISTSDACNYLIQFFTHVDEMSDIPAPVVSLRDTLASQSSHRKDAPSSQQSDALLSKHTIYNLGSTSRGRDLLLQDYHQKDLKATLLSDMKTENELRFGSLLKKDGFESLESLVLIKEAEASMFQKRADDARREAEEYKNMVRARSEKLEEEYADKLSKLCLQDTEERRRKKLEELKMLENSHCDYYRMKMRMQVDIAGLLERMEAIKQKWVQ